MKKLLLSLSILASTNAFAVHNGGVDFHAVNPSDYPSIVEDGGTGTMVAGRFVISAGHVVSNGSGTNWHSFGSQEFYASQAQSDSTDRFAYSNYGKIDQLIPHQEWKAYTDYIIFEEYVDETQSGWKDLSITHSVTQIKADKIIFLADLTTATTQPKAGDAINSFGSHCEKAVLGRNETCNKQLNDTQGFSFATRIVKESSKNKLELDTRANSSYMVSGDSGGAVTNSAGNLVAVNVASSSSAFTGDSYTLLHGYSDIILAVINRWHYPTVAKVVEGGMHETVIQSLRDPKKEQLDLSNTIEVTGDVSMPTLDADCTNTKPYAKCTIHYTSNGGVGRIILADDQYIDINPKAKPAIVDLRSEQTKKEQSSVTETSTAQPSSSGSGSSGAGIGMYALFALLSVALIRRKKITL